MQVVSRWSTLVDDFSTSGQDFYEQVQEAVERRGLDGISFSRVMRRERGLISARREYLRVSRNHLVFDICAAPYGQSFFFSWWLLRLGPKYPVLYIVGFLGATLFFPLVAFASFKGGCAGVAGALLTLIGTPVGLFVFAAGGAFGPPEHVTVVPWLGPIFKALFNPDTFYSLDTTTMFQESIRRDVNAVLEGILSEGSVDPLEDDQWKPTLGDLLK